MNCPESDDGESDDGGSSSVTEASSEDEYMEEYSYDSPSSDSGGPVDKELNPLLVAKKQLSLDNDFIMFSWFDFPSALCNLSAALFFHIRDSQARLEVHRPSFDLTAVQVRHLVDWGYDMLQKTGLVTVSKVLF